MNTRKAQRRRGARADGGVTLIELTLVLAITAAILTAGVARLGRSGFLQSEGQQVARRLAADLRYAHSQAIAGGASHYLRFTSAGFGSGDGLTVCTQYAIYRVEAGGDVQAEPPRVFPSGVSVAVSALRAEFTPAGSAVAAYTFKVNSTARSYRITVTLATGAVRLQEL